MLKFLTNELGGEVFEEGGWSVKPRPNLFPHEDDFFRCGGIKMRQMRHSKNACVGACVRMCASHYFRESTKMIGYKIIL